MIEHSPSHNKLRSKKKTNEIHNGESQEESREFQDQLQNKLPAIKDDWISAYGKGIRPCQELTS